MRSIRRSLIVSFLFLTTAALAAVAWVSYHTTSVSLREREHDSRKLIETQCDANCKAERDDLDRRILQQAQRLANLSESNYIHAEGQLAFAGMFGHQFMPGGGFNSLLYWHQVNNKDLASRLFNMQPLSTHIASPERMVPEEDGKFAQEYFQTYRSNGWPMQRSESMGEERFSLQPKVRKRSAPAGEVFDEVEMKNGVRVRRVTLKAYVASFGVRFSPWLYKGVAAPFFPAKQPIRPPFVKGGGKGPRGMPGRPIPRPPVIRTHFFYIQYASDLAPTEAKILSFQQGRDHQIAELSTATDRDLAKLQTRMFWIGLSSLAALWLGGYVVIRMGLAPLSKMSDAVSRVSPRDFQLPMDHRQLPQELQPIAERLVKTLEHLQKAFEREKQAAADISHELRTPLAALMTTLEVGLRKFRSPEEYREILEECRGSGQNMYHLVERLLTLARLDAGADQYRPADVDVIDLAIQCADLIRPLARAKDLDLTLHLPDPITTRTDPNKLREVLTNLLHNAVEYNQPNGTIYLSIEQVKGRVRIEVRDTGIGIKPEVLPRIFERFFRADASRYAETPHAGLGLAIVKSYVDLMDGTIQVQSSDLGTSFLVELPLLAPTPALTTAVRPKLEYAQR
ncbi:MAG: HAMP domain-containing histidine kinase [Planctomycetes bacterium]|nr:HAMP domain-containing histidine kinase [Planctomycetota bacterium]